MMVGAYRRGRIRERAAELAGICEIEAMPAGGTRLHIRLPLPKATEREE